MRHNLENIELAYEFVSSQTRSRCAAYLSRTDGKTYYVFDSIAEADELPEDFDESDAYIAIPHRDDLGLGRPLVFDFISNHAPDFYEQVREIFSHRGAYERYKALLSTHGLRNLWFKFEHAETRSALIQWCEENPNSEQ